MKTALWEVEGMWCGGCARALEKAVGGLTGVSRARAHLESASLALDYDPALVDDSSLLRRSASLGYKLSSVDWTGQRDDNPLAREVRDLQFRLAVSVFWGMWLMLATIPTYSWRGQPLFEGLNAQESAVMGAMALLLSLPILIYGAAPFHRMTWRWARVGLLGTDSLVSVGATLSWILSAGNLLQGRVELYCDALAGLVIVLLWARLLQLSARQRSRQSLNRLLAEAPRTYRENEGGPRAAVEQAVEGGPLWLKGPTAVPLDAVVLSGQGDLDEALLTGEALPRSIFPGDRMMAGTRLLQGQISGCISAPLGGRRIDELARGMRTAQARQGSLAGLSDRAAALVSWALLLVTGGTLLLYSETPLLAVERALAVLVVGCPCALTLAVPLVAHVVEGRAREEGIVFQDMRSLEALADARRFVFDKTGTLSLGRPELMKTRVRKKGWTPQTARECAAAALHGSSHPFAVALRQGVSVPPSTGELENIPGMGGRRGTVLVGSAYFLQQNGIPCAASAGSSCELAVDGVWIASFLFQDNLDTRSVSTVRQLAKRGYEVGVRSGDRPEALEALQATGIRWSELSAGLSPEEKAHGLDLGAAVFVGDGINDTLALSSASVGVAVGSASAAAVEAAGVHLPDVADLPRALGWSRLSVRRMRLCLLLSCVYNFGLIPAAAFGWVSPALAALAMGLSSLSVVALAVGTALPSEQAYPTDTDQGRGA